MNITTIADTMNSLPPLFALSDFANEMLGYFLFAMIFLMAFVVLVLFLIYGRLWLQAFMSNARVSMTSLIGMSLRQVHARTIVEAKIMAYQSGIGIDPETGRQGITTDQLEEHYLAGGDLIRVVNAVIAANRANINLGFEQACAIDLAGRDVFLAVQTSVTPKVIVCPDPTRGKGMLSAVARDGVELRVRANVTVRTNLLQLIGGATEETIIARVGEGIISAIGSSDTHMKVLENPDRISREVLSKGLDAQTAFSIISIDIADVDIGEQIGARLQVDQAAADTRKAQALAEQRRVDAVAHEQEMKAEVISKQAEVILAEAEIPQAIAQAFRDGSINN